MPRRCVLCGRAGLRRAVAMRPACWLLVAVVRLGLAAGAPRTADERLLQAMERELTGRDKVHRSHHGHRVRHHNQPRGTLAPQGKLRGSGQVRSQGRVNSRAEQWRHKVSCTARSGQVRSQSAPSAALDTGTTR